MNSGYEWVFKDPDTFTVEKLHGANVKLKTENGRLIALQNRKNLIDPLPLMGGPSAIVEGVVFYNLKRREQHQTWMAKLRRDMFHWYYDSDIKILS